MERIDTSNPTSPIDEKALATERKKQRQVIHQRLGTKFNNMYSVHELRLDNLNKYKDYVNLDNINLIREDVNKLRAQNQNELIQLSNATWSGLGKGALGAIEGASYVLDIDNHIKAFNSLDDTEKNWIAKMATSGKEWLDEIMPIYRENPNEVFDWSDPAFYFESWRELLNSAVQFAVPGGAITKGFSALGHLSKANKVLQFLKASPTLSKTISGLPAAGVTNWMEGKIMGLELADEIERELRPLVDSGQMTIDELNQAKMDAHDNIINMNRFLSPVNMFQLSGIMKGQQYTRNLLKEKGIANRFKHFGESLVKPNADNLILQNLGEGVEEIVQGIMSGESKYQSLKKIGQEEGPELLMERLVEYATKDETLLEGLMGFFGGGVQRIITESSAGKYTKSSKEQYKKMYDEQQQMKESTKLFFEGKLESAAPYMMAKNKAMQEGDIASAEAIDNIMFAREAANHFKLGTTEILESHLNEIANGNITAEQAEYMGKDAQQKAIKLIDKLKSYENIWAKHALSSVQYDIFNNRVTRDALANSLTGHESKLLELDSSIKNEISNTLIPLLKNSKDVTYDIDEILNKVKQDLIEKDKGNKVKRDLSSDSDKLIAATSNLENIYEYFNTQNNITSIKNNLKKYDKEYSNLRTVKGEEERLKEIKDIQERFKQARKLKNDTESESITSPKKNDILEDRLGNIYKVDNYNKDKDKWELSSIDGKKKLILSNKRFEDNFKNKTENSFKRRVNKEVLKERKNETNGNNAAKNAPKNSPEGKANETNNAPKKPNKSEDVEPKSFEDNNKKTKTPEELIINKENHTDNTNRLTWRSFNNISFGNPDKSKEAKDKSDYLENPNNNIIGKKVKIEKDNNNKDGIKVTLLDSENNPITHNSTEIILYIPEPKGNSEADKLLIAYRETLIKEIENNNGIVFSTVTSKSPGYIQWNTTLENLDLALASKAEDIELSIVVNNGKFIKGIDKGNEIEDSDLIGFTNSEIGGVYAKVKTSNDTWFPLRLTINKVSETEANFIKDVYIELLGNKKITDKLSDETKKKLNSSEDLKAILKIFKNINQITYSELLKVLVHDGIKSKEFASFPVWTEKRTLHFGKGEFYKSMTAKELQANSEEFINWLTNYKTKNIAVNQLANPKYKKYLIETGVLQTKVSFNERGIIFAQPLVEIDNVVNNETTTTTTTSQSNFNIEAEKTKIEKRRQEALYGELTTEQLEAKKYWDSKVSGQQSNPNYYLSNSLNALNTIMYLNKNRPDVKQRGEIVPKFKFKKISNNSERTYIANINEDKINSKYDAELADLEQSTVEIKSNFNKKLAIKIQETLQNKYPEIKLNITNNPIWEQGDNIFNQQEFNKQLNYKLKVTELLMSPKGDEIFRKGDKNNWSIDKILQELQVPKQQQELIKSFNTRNREEILTNLLANYSYTVEINTAKEVRTLSQNEAIQRQGNDKIEEGDIVEYNGNEYSIYEVEQNFSNEDMMYNFTYTLSPIDNVFDPETNPNGIDIVFNITSEKFKVKRTKNNDNSSYYSNLTVPGGTNYTENEIATPDITPSIKGHAQFATENGIGWFRSDDKGKDLGETKEVNMSDLPDDIDDQFETKKVLTPTKTRRILEVQSDLFQKGRDKSKLAQNKINFDNDDFMGDDFIEDTIGNQFLQLLNKDNNWVTFFIKSIIQDSAKKGYEKVLFPKGETAAKIEGHETIAEEIKRLDYKLSQEKSKIKINITITNVNSFPINEHKENYAVKYKDKYYLVDILISEGDSPGWEEITESKFNQYLIDVQNGNNPIIKDLELRKQELKSQGIEKLKPIESFYENTVTNILKKQGLNPNIITDEHGNTWNEITINQARDLANILLQKNEVGKIIGQANIKAMTVLIDAVNQKQDTLPHEYAHHYIAWNRNTPIVQEAIKKWGSEESLVQAIGEQSVKQKGEAWNWWTKFVKWLLGDISKISKLDKEKIKNILTDAFLERQDLNNLEQSIETDSAPLSEEVNDIFEKAIKEKEKKSKNKNEIKNEELNKSKLKNDNFEIENSIKNNLIEFQEMLFANKKITSSQKESLTDILELFEIYKDSLLSGEIDIEVIKEEFNQLLENCK